MPERYLLKKLILMVIFINLHSDMLNSILLPKNSFFLFIKIFEGDLFFLSEKLGDKKPFL